MAEEKKEEEGQLVLVVRKGCFGLPTACPSCLPVYLYLRFANVSFDLELDVKNPDSDFIPYVEYGDVVFFNDEMGGVIEGLKEEGIVDLDSKLPSHCFPEWLSTKAMISSWLVEAAQYELWVASDGKAANEIYFSDLSYPIRKGLHWKQTRSVKQQLGISKLKADEREKEIYRKAALAYESLSMRLGDDRYFFEDRPTSVDTIFLGHALFVLHALSDTSVLRSALLKHDNLVQYSESHKMQLLEASSSLSSSVPRSPFDASTPRKKPFSYWSSKPKPKAKKEKTEEEKTFRRRAKYFLATQLVSVLVFLSLLGGSDDAELEDGDESGITYEDD